MARSFSASSTAHWTCRPGDYALWKSEEAARNTVGVVQTASAVDRMATIKWLPQDQPTIPDDSTIAQVPLLELDVHGTGFASDTSGNSVAEVFGARRGDFVLIHSEDTKNGSTNPPLIPRIGEVESWVTEQSPMFPEDQVTGWRGDMTNFGMDVLTARGYASASAAYCSKTLDEQQNSEAEVDSIRWFGQVTEVCNARSFIEGAFINRKLDFSYIRTAKSVSHFPVTRS